MKGQLLMHISPFVLCIKIYVSRTLAQEPTTLARYLTAREGSAKRGADLLRAAVTWRRRWQPRHVPFDEMAVHWKSGKVGAFRFFPQFIVLKLGKGPRLRSQRSCLLQTPWTLRCLDPPSAP